MKAEYPYNCALVYGVWYDMSWMVVILQFPINSYVSMTWKFLTLAKRRKTFCSEGSNLEIGLKAHWIAGGTEKWKCVFKIIELLI